MAGVLTGGSMAAGLPWLVGSLAVVVCLCLLRRPLGGLLRLTARTGAGLAFLAVFSPLGQALGAGLGVNLFNALVLGVLGAPGFGLLMLLRWVLR